MEHVNPLVDQVLSLRLGGFDYADIASTINHLYATNTWDDFEIWSLILEETV